MKKGQLSDWLPFFRRRYFLFLMGCNKKLYNVLGGFTLIIIAYAIKKVCTKFTE